MTDLPGRHRFVAYARRGLATSIPAGTASDGAVVPVTLHVDTDRGSRDVPEVKLRLHGPGNVAGLDTRQVIRTDPKANTTEFEPNYLANCDLDDPFLPWLFSPEQTNARLKPWLALVVLDRDTAELKSDPRRPLPWIELSLADAAEQLHDLGESWAWAHAQIMGSEAAPNDALVQPPEANLSRLVCPRRLRASRAYRACLVPAYLAGVEAGRGEAPTAAPGVPAWPQADSTGQPRDPVDLPVYYSWEFTTSPAGDFESLARRLRPQPLAPEIGGRPMSLAEAGANLPVPPPGQPGRELALEGILGSPGMVSSDWPKAARAPFQARLEQLLEAPPGAEQTVLSPPIYASAQAGTGAKVPPDGGERPWLRRLNLDPRFRVPAGLGTRVVQELQEQLMASAWDQAGELERANELLRNAQLARATAAASSEKHLGSLRADALLRVTEPVHARVRLDRDGKQPEERPDTGPNRPDADTAPPRTLLGGIADPEGAFPQAAVAAPFRKVTRPGGPVGRHLPEQPDPPVTYLSQRLAVGEVSVPITPAEGGADFDKVADRAALPPDPARRPSVAQAVATLPTVRHGFTKVEVDAVDGPGLYHRKAKPAEPALGGSVKRDARDVLEPGEAAEPGGLQRKPDDEFEPPDETDPLRKERVRAINRRFKNAAVALLGQLPAPPASKAPLTLQLQGVKEGLVGSRGGPVSLDGEGVKRLGVLDPERTVAREVLPLVPEGPATEPDPTSGRVPDRLRPRAAAPRFPQPMSEPLKAIDREMLLPGVERIDPDSIGIAVTNARVLESYMAGLNHELGRELLWRSLPADLGATFFQQFWDVRGSGPDTPGTTDIPPIDQWGLHKDLGENATRVGGEGMLVLIIRGELLRRYPTTAVYAARAVPKLDEHGNPVLENGAPVSVPGKPERYPEFRGTLDPDLSYLGFDLGIAEASGQGSDLGWFFVLQEQPTAPRFGLDEPPEDGMGAAPPETWAGLHWGHPFAKGTDPGAIKHLRVAGPLSERPPPEPTPLRLPVLKGHAATAAWGVDSAQMAAITYQRPMRVALHARTMLPDVPDPSLRVTRVARADGGVTAFAGDGWKLAAAEAADAVARGAAALFVADGDERVKLVPADGGALTTEHPDDAHLLAELPEIGVGG